MAIEGVSSRGWIRFRDPKTRRDGWRNLRTGKVVYGSLPPAERAKPKQESDTGTESLGLESE